MGGRHHRVPPYQLIKGDKYNISLGVAACFVLAALKDVDRLPTLGRFQPSSYRAHPFFLWSMNAYTNWNLAFVMMRVVLRQGQWDPFLLTNSMGILCGFRAGFCQGLDENMRKKIRGLGF